MNESDCLPSMQRERMEEEGSCPAETKPGNNKKISISVFMLKPYHICFSGGILQGNTLAEIKVRNVRSKQPLHLPDRDCKE